MRLSGLTVVWRGTPSLDDWVAYIAKGTKSKKLIRLTVDVGEAEPRTILAGIAEAYQPEQLVGRTIAIVANLKPAKLMGIESNGMVLAASPEGGLPSLVAIDDSLPAGARIR